MKINLVTGNKNKVGEYKRLFSEEGIEVEHLEIDYPELRHDSFEEITKEAAERVSDETGKVVVLEDGGFFVESLDGFPGVSSAYFFKRLGSQGILKLMQDIDERRCYYKVAVAYCEPGEKAEIFVGEEKGRVAGSEKGENGWGYDNIFIPEGSEQTYGEIKKEEDICLFRQIAVKKLMEFLTRHRSD
ncbi:RdgB/HAM1 family non-canonical purine NTP pyrophosphatase [Candidatus Woesearchaeota archaeon]|nr:RdgB/HAM1 family non-canonical purine NTP pyrophosphatase [Candidatus Woesearchaeota archaeon]